MDQMERQKELSLAMNGRMALLVAGIMVTVTAVLSSTGYAINMFVAVNGLLQGKQEFVDMFSEAGIGAGAAIGAGVAFAASAVTEIFVGILCIRFSNRVNRARMMVKCSVALLVVEIAAQIYLFAVRISSAGALFSAIVLPLILLWGSTRLAKLAKKYPEREYAIERGKNTAKPAGASGSAPKKALRERAAMKAEAWDEAARAVEAEKAASPDSEALPSLVGAKPEKDPAAQDSAKPEKDSAAQDGAKSEKGSAAQDGAGSEEE